LPHITDTGRIVVTKEELKNGVKFCITENKILLETYDVIWKD
jgi:hypothetical protein